MLILIQFVAKLDQEDYAQKVSYSETLSIILTTHLEFVNLV